jgi:hypothetical protein
MKPIKLILLFCVSVCVSFAAAELLKQSTARNITFFMTDSTDNVTGKTSLTVTCTLSKDAGSFNASGGSVSEISSGWYSLAANTTDTGTLGDLAMHCTGTGANATDVQHQVVADLPGATVSSVTGSVGSVTGAVGSVTGAVGSVTGNVGGNVVGSVASVTGAVGSVTGNIGGNVVGSVASVTGAVGSVTGAVGSVTGNIGGNIVGSVASVTAGVTVSTNNDKTGYALSTAGIQAVWDRGTSNLTTASSIGKLLVDDIDATVSSRLATSSYTAPDNASITAIKAKTDNLPATPAAQANIDAIKTITDQFSFASGNVNAKAVTVADKTGYSLAASTIPIKKNTALANFEFPMNSSTSGNPTTSLTVSCQRSIDGASFASCANSVSEIGSGYYKVSFAASDLNGDTIVVRFFATGAKEKSVTFITQ